MAKLAKYLCLHGHDVLIVTSFVSAGQTQDESLLSDIPSDATVLRYQSSSILLRLLGTNEYGNGFVARATRKVLRPIVAARVLPDLEILWTKDAKEKILADLSAWKPEVILSSSSPYSMHLLAAELSLVLHVPYVADFRDPWVRNHFAPPSAKNLTRHMALEESVVNSAACLTVVSRPMVDLLRQDHRGLLENKITCIPNGYDEADFLSYHPQRSSAFTILFAGSIYGPIRLDPLVDAVRELKRELADDRPVRLQIIGQSSSKATAVAQSLALVGVEVDIRGYQPHEELIRTYETANVLLVIIPKTRGSSLVYTGKIFEYLRTGKDILCLAGAGVATDLVRETNTGLTADPDDPKAILVALQTLYRAWSVGQTACGPSRGLEVYSRETIAREFEAVLTQAVRGPK